MRMRAGALISGLRGTGVWVDMLLNLVSIRLYLHLQACQRFRNLVAATTGNATPHATRRKKQSAS